MKIDKFENLECWQVARKLVNVIYGLINRDDKFKHDYRLRDQVTSAAVSIMSNIAEGFSRQSNREFIQFLFISNASSSELQSLLYVALDQGYISEKSFRETYEQANKVSQINSGLIRYLRSTTRNKT